MGNADTITKLYMSNNDIFADVFNFFIYDGSPVIDPDHLTAIDTTEIAVPGGDFEHAEYIQKYRDILKSAAVMEDDAATYLLLGIENQSTVNYAMPVRNMVYDALQYDRQVRTISSRHRRNGDRRGLSPDEFLSGFSVGDRLTPVVTLAVYFGADEWTAPCSLHEMMDLKNRNLVNAVQDYRINLIQPAKLTDEDFRKFRTNFRIVMNFLKVSRDKAGMKNLIEHEESLRHLSTDAALVLKNCANLNITIDESAEVTDMCQAWTDMANECRAEGEVQGEKRGEIRGKAKGRTEGLAEAYYKMVWQGFVPPELAAAELHQSEEEFQTGLKNFIAGMN